MRLRIRHRTVYRYDQPIAYAIQSLRLAPRDFDGQRVEHWSVSATERRQPLTTYLDGYGNRVMLHTRNEPHEQTEIDVSGVVTVDDRHGVVAGAPEPLPPLFYLRHTPLTAADAALTAFANAAGQGGCALDRVHRLAGAIAERVAYRGGESNAHTTAAEAFAAGAGVCQDHAHVMIACARALGHPARYVSGYLHVGDGDQVSDASHAWAEVHVEDLGWVGFDPSNGVCPTDRYVRTAIGLDYWSAAPIRGLWRGQADEKMSVAVQVSAADSAQ
ncbi:MAG: transglutaminase family protein [Alphaproteobacteria bacterium]